MLNLSEETQHGLRQLKTDITALTNKESVTTIYEKKNIVDLVKLSLAVGICTTVLYTGLVMVFDYNVLMDKIPVIVLILAGCAFFLGILTNTKKVK